MEKPSTKSITSIFDKAGSIARGGIVTGASYIAKGINKTGDFVKANTSEHTESSNVAILPHIETASKVTSVVVGTSHKFLGKAVNKTLEVAEETWYSMPESELMKKICENETFQVSMEIGKAGANAGLNVIGGVSEGLSLVTDSSVHTTVGIMEHKYGENAGKATKETFNIAGDIVGAYQLTYMTGIIGVTAGEVMKIKEEQAKFDFMMQCLTNIVI